MEIIYLVHHCTIHAPWRLSILVQSMHHGRWVPLYNPWVMEIVYLDNCCTTHGLWPNIHSAWIVQGYLSSWGMDGTIVNRVHGLHAPWVAQWYLPPMGHGLCGGTHL